MISPSMRGTQESATPTPQRHGASPPRVLVVDDEADLRELLEITLIGMGLDVDCAASVAQARECLRQRPAGYALCLTDMRLPDGLGMELLATLSREHPGTPVAVITAYGSADNAVAALKAGAFDYLSKPVSLEALRSLVRSAIAPVQTPPGEVVAVDVSATARILGSSEAIRAVREQILRLARSMAPVAITGESGSGKELAARVLHASGARAAGPFVAVNCGAIPEHLMESEFFGHRKGAFTGADQEREGFFQAADGGTLFLDEVAELPLPMQVKLLRAIQEKRVRKLGSNTEDAVDVRIVSATHQDLALCVAHGRFRQDLYYRLNVIELRLPPLRERPGDLPELAAAILAKLAQRAGLERAPRLSTVAASYLQSYTFPGNVRELENLLERALAFSNGEVINIEDLGLRPAPAGDARASLEALEITSAAAQTPTPMQATQVASAASDAALPSSLPAYLDQIERETILRALDQTRFNRTAAARLLGVSFRALRHRMQRLGIR